MVRVRPAGTGDPLTQQVGSPSLPQWASWFRIDETGESLLMSHVLNQESKMPWFMSDDVQ